MSEKFPQLPDRVDRYACTCPRCKKFFTRDVTMRHNGQYENVTPYNPTPHYRPKFYLVGENPHHMGCPFCSFSVVSAKPIEGHYSENVPCDRRCTHAKGHKCECSCGGKNHGLDHRIQ